MIRILYLPFLFVSLFVFLSCGDSGTDNDKYFDFTGSWREDFNFITFDNEDSCYGNAFQGNVFISDITINQIGENDFERLDSDLVNYFGELNENGELIFLKVARGDLSNDGSYCERTEKYSYLPNRNNGLVFLGSIFVVCNDGFSCNDEAIGEAVRK